MPRVQINVIDRNDPRWSNAVQTIDSFAAEHKDNGSFMCDPVSRRYIHSVALPHAETILLAQEHKKGKRTPTGFLLAKWPNRRVGDGPLMPDTLYTNVVCSRQFPKKYSTKPLIFKSFKEARKRGKRLAVLDALRHTEGYYPRFGYFSGPEPTTPDLVPRLRRFYKNLYEPRNWFPSTPISTPPKAPRTPSPDPNAGRRPWKQARKAVQSHPLKNK